MRLLVMALSVVFLLVQMGQPLAQVAQLGQFLQLAQLDTGADSGGIDLDPPQVDHIPVASGIAGSPQSISVKAVDVQGISSVTLLYRANQADEFKQVLMQQVSGTDNFTVLIDVSSEQRLVEYYFLVIDIGGNKVLNGFPYEPFSRLLTEPPTTIEDSTQATIDTPQTSPPQSVADTLDTEQAVNNKTALLWVALGVLVVGALAAGSSGEGDQNAGTTGETVPVILNVPLPD